MKAEHRTRESIVDGLFYPANPERLTESIVNLLEAAVVQRADASIIIAPHASYEYCGEMLAYSYKAARDRAPETIVVIAPVHREPTNRIFLTESNQFATPMGPIGVDTEKSRELETCSTKIICNDIPHLEEHAIEVQLPFIKHVFPESKIIPILIGHTTQANVRAMANALGSVFHNSFDSTLFVVSSNLCSKCDGDRAKREIDALTGLIEQRDSAGIVERFDAKEITCCGSGCIASILSLNIGNLDVMTHGTACAHHDDTLPATKNASPAATYYGSFSFHGSSKAS